MNKTKVKNVYSAYIVYDLETGGLHSEKNPIIEIAFVVLLRNKEGSLYIDENLSFDSLILPYNEDLIIEDKALEVNKITRKDIKKYGNDVENIKEVLLELLEVINPKNNERYRPILVGHNIDNFDNDFLKKFLKDIGAPDINILFSKGGLDTLKLTKILFEGEKIINSFSLSSLCDFFGIKNENNHRAMGDAVANAKLLMKLIEMFKINRREFLKIKESKKDGN